MNRLSIDQRRQGWLQKKKQHKKGREQLLLLVSCFSLHCFHGTRCRFKQATGEDKDALK